MREDSRMSCTNPNNHAIFSSLPNHSITAIKFRYKRMQDQVPIIVLSEFYFLVRVISCDLETLFFLSKESLDYSGLSLYTSLGWGVGIPRAKALPFCNIYKKLAGDNKIGNFGWSHFNYFPMLVYIYWYVHL